MSPINSLRRWLPPAFTALFNRHNDSRHCKNVKQYQMLGAISLRGSRSDIRYDASFWATPITTTELTGALMMVIREFEARSMCWENFAAEFQKFDAEKSRTGYSRKGQKLATVRRC